MPDLTADWKRYEQETLARAREKWGHVVFLHENSRLGRKLKLGKKVQMSSVDAIKLLREGRISRLDLLFSLNYTRDIICPDHRKMVPVDRFAGKNVLDFGCGSGVEMLAFEPYVKSIVGADVVRGNVDLCSALILDGTPPEFMCTKFLGDYDHILSLGKFDVVYSCGVLHHIDDLYWRQHGVTKMKPSPVAEKVIHLLQQCCAETFVASAVYTNHGLARWRPQDLAAVVERGGMRVTRLEVYNKGRYLLLEAKR